MAKTNCDPASAALVQRRAVAIRCSTIAGHGCVDAGEVIIARNWGSNIAL
jgi:hypothetical protein